MFLLLNIYILHILAANYFLLVDGLLESSVDQIKSLGSKIKPEHPLLGNKKSLKVNCTLVSGSKFILPFPPHRRIR